MFNGVAFKDCETVKFKSCVVCTAEFKPKSGVHKFCSDTCKGKWKYITGTFSTENQYKEISGNWDRYLSRLLYAAGRKRDRLTRRELFEILVRQDYRCAISGLPLTCQLALGTKFWSNASVDRIKPGGTYSKDNIQLVCKAVNSWRSNMPLDDFIEVCRAVAAYNPKRESEEKDG